MRKSIKLKKQVLEKQKICLYLLQKAVKEEKEEIYSYIEKNGLKEIPKIEDIEDIEFLETLKSFECHSVELKYLEKIINLKEKEIKAYLN